MILFEISCKKGRRLAGRSRVVAVYPENSTEFA